MKNYIKKISLIFASVAALVAVFCGVFLLKPETQNIELKIEVFSTTNGAEITPSLTNGGNIQILENTEVLTPISTTENALIFSLNPSKSYTFSASPAQGFGFAGAYTTPEFGIDNLITNSAEFSLNETLNSTLNPTTENQTIFAKFGKMESLTLSVQTSTNTTKEITANFPLSIDLSEAELIPILQEKLTPASLSAYTQPNQTLAFFNENGAVKNFNFTKQNSLVNLAPSPLDSVGTAYTVTFNANGGTVSPTTTTVNVTAVSFYFRTWSNYWTDGVNNRGSWSSSSSSATLERYWYCNTTTSTYGGPYMHMSISLTANTYIIFTFDIKTTKTMNFNSIGHEQGGKKTYTSSTSYTNFKHVFVAVQGTGDGNEAFSAYSTSWTSGTYIYVKNFYLYTTQKYTTLPTPTRTGYTFNGWYKESSFTNQVTTSTICDTVGNHTLYAKWTKDPVVVTFNANGGSVSPATTTVNMSEESFSFNTCSEYWHDGVIKGSWSNTSSTPTIERYWNCSSSTSVMGGPYLGIDMELSAGNYYAISFDIKTSRAINQDIGHEQNGKINFTTTTSYAHIKHAFTARANTNGNAVFSFYTTSWASGDYLYVKNFYIFTTQKYGTLPTPTRTGYTFNGWYKESNFVNKVTADTLCDTVENHTLYAKWTGYPYTVKYNANGGTGTMANSSHTYGTSKALTANSFAKIGYTFQGWDTNSAGTTVVYANSASVSTLTSTNGGTVTLYAVWKANTYTVVYNANGGLGSMSNSSHTYDTAKNLTANAYTKQGYIFLGWSTSSSATSATYTNQQSVKNLTATANGTVTLYAVWGYAYMVEYNGNGGIGDTPASIHTFNQPSNLTANGFTKTGYTFLGWSRSSGAITATYTNGQEVNNLASTQYATVILYAVWQGNSYTVHYDANGGSGSMENSSHVYGTESELSVCTFTREGYLFEGWSLFSDAKIQTYNDRQKISTLTATANATVTLYAIWLKKDITVTVDPNGGVYNGVETATVYNCSVGSDLVLGVPSRPGYEFTEFNTSGDGMGQTLNGTMVLNGDVTFYALWQPLNYVIKYYDGDLYLGQTEAWYNENLSLPRWETLLSNNSLSGGKFTQFGWNFAGWTADANGTQIEHTNGGAVLNLAEAGTTINLYAMHTQTLSLTYNGNGATSGNVANASYDILLNSKSEKFADFVIKLANNSYSKTNYSFKNWAIGSTSGTQKSAGGNITNVDLNLTYSSSFSKTVYAIWQGNSYTINYYNGTEKIATENYVYGTNATLKTFSTIGTVTNFTYGWEFYGWATANNTFTRVFVDGANITNISIENGAEITQNKVINLYSIYSREVSFVSGLNKASTTTATQFWNPYSTNNSNLSSVLAEAPQTIETGNWIALGYRADLTAGTATFALTTKTEIRPTANTFNTLYAVYSRTITITDLNTTTTATQYYNSAGTVSTVGQ